MKVLRRVSGKSIISLAVLGLFAGVTAGPLWAAPNVPIPGYSSIISVALTSDAVSPDNPASAPASRFLLREMTVAPGDTLAAMLAVSAIDRRDVAAAMAALRKRFNPRKLVIGRKLHVVVETGLRGADRLAALSLELGKSSYLVIERVSGRRYVSRYMQRPLELDTGDHGAAALGDRSLRVRAGDTLTGMLVRAGASRDDADKAAIALGRLFNLRRLQIGQEVIISFRGGALTTVSLKVARDAYVTARRDGLGAYAARRAASPAPPPEAIVETPAPAAPKAAPVTETIVEPVAEIIIEPLAASDDETRRTYRIAKGDTLTGALVLLGVDHTLAYRVSNVLGSVFNLRKLQIGQQLTLVFDPGSATRKPGLAAVSLRLKPGRYVVVGRDDAGGYYAEKATAALLPTFPDADTLAAEEGLIDSVAPPLEVSAYAAYKTLAVRRGDTLTTALLRMGAAWSEADAVVAALSRHVDPRNLRVGQVLSAVMDKPAGRESQAQLIAVSLIMGEDSSLVAHRNDDGSFTAWPAIDDLNDVFDEALLAAPPPPIELAAIPDNALKKLVDVRAGDTLMNALLKAGSDPGDAEAAINVLKALFDPRKLRAGQRLEIAFVPGADGGKPVLQRLTIPIAPGRDVETGRMDNGVFAARAVEAPLQRIMIHAGGSIESSLYQAAADAGVPVPVLWELIRAFSYDVDFQREIQRGDGFEVLFERYLDDTGEAVREGNIVYAALTLSGAPLRIYRYTDGDGFADYYSEAGHSVRKALLRTPIDGARLTSGFGRRKHPVLGYTKMHRGVDFGAARGTPFMAAGDGVVEVAGWNGAYGKYIRLRHRGSYSTAYAHLSRIASGITPGRRIKQGQIIGYVGSTGRSTGPHLHYEVLQGGRQINPLTVKLPTGAKLSGAELAAFLRVRSGIESQLAELPLVNRVADAMIPAAE